MRISRHAWPRPSLAPLAVILFMTPAGADDPAILFDLSPVIAARSAEQSDGGDTVVTIQLKLSSMIASAEMPRIDQWLVRCRPRDTSMSIVDYAPRTEVASELQGGIQVKKTDEKTESLGISLEGSYGLQARGNAGADRGNKQTNSLQFERVAPVQTVIASGTIDRGRGVYFKLRWTSQQVLEGEKSFQLTFQVPGDWRGSLIDVTVIAQAEHRPFPGWESKDKTIGAAHFVVAAYLDGDPHAARLAHQLAEAEDSLRTTTRERTDSSDHWLPVVLRRFATKLELPSNLTKASWIQRLLQGEADPYLDDEIRELPMPIRIAALDYCDARDEFHALRGGDTSRDNGSRHFVAKPPQ